MSAWVMGPDRRLDSVELDDVPPPDDATFHPDLVSNQILRDTVVSSGYGMSVPIVEREITYRDPNETFSPELIDSKVATEIRRKVVSSKYGARTAQPKKAAPKPKKPKFKPVVKRTDYAKRLVTSAPSSGYGKIPSKELKSAVQKAPEKPPLEYNFQPKLNVSKKVKRLRRRSQSRGYGYEDVVLEEKEDHDDKQPAVVKRKHTLVHTLLTQEAQPDSPEKEEPSFEVDFVLDGVRTGNCLNPMTKHNLPLVHVHTVLQENELPPSPLKGHFDTQARSAGYGTAAYKLWEIDRETEKANNMPWHKNPEHPANKRPVHKDKENVEEDERWDIRQSRLQELAVEDLDLDELTMADKNRKNRLNYTHVTSSQYGVVPPDVAPKPLRDQPSMPPWTGFAGKPGGKDFPSADDVPVAKPNPNVRSNKYGRVGPAVVPRKYVEPEPAWVPSGINAPIPTIDQLDYD